MLRSTSRLSFLPALLFVSALGFALPEPAGPAPGAVPSSGPRAAADDEIVQEFKRYFRKFKDRATRIEAIHSLDGAETPGVVGVLAPILADEDSEVVDAAVKVLAGFKQRAPIDSLFATLAEEKKEPVRLGLLRAITAGGYTAESEALVECLQDKSWMVRYRAVQALQARAQRSAIPRLIELTQDKEPGVRCASLEALASLREAQVVDLAIAALQDEVWQVRSSAAGALRELRAKRSIEPLIARMELEVGRLISDYADALEEITAKGFGMRTEMWRDWWTGIADRFEIPTDEQLAVAKAKRAENQARYSPPGSTNYHGIETPSRAVLFIIDVSGSMENHVVEVERFADGDYPSMSRIDIVKTELQRTIEGLESYVRFNILAFATDVKSWKKKLVPCNVLNQRSAMDWVGRLEAIGGSSKEDLARAGLTGAANLEAGKTNTYGVLMKGLGVAGRGTHDAAYDVEVDTIFFLSDGRPTAGELIDPDDILQEVRVANELRKVVIHTIALGEFQKEFMRTLARENGGVFVDLGR
jgi:hypothetical protein